jgi:regulator of replication initiation timing
MATTQIEQSVRLQVQRLKELSSQLQSMMDAQVKVRQQRDRDRDRLEKKSPTPEKRANVRRR